MMENWQVKRAQSRAVRYCLKYKYTSERSVKIWHLKEWNS